MGRGQYIVEMTFHSFFLLRPPKTWKTHFLWGSNVSWYSVQVSQDICQLYRLWAAGKEQEVHIKLEQLPQPALDQSQAQQEDDGEEASIQQLLACFIL